MRNDWLNIDTAREAAKELAELAPRAEVRFERHDLYEDKARVRFVLRDAATGNTVSMYMGLDADSAKELVAKAESELHGRKKATRDRIRRENAPN